MRLNWVNVTVLWRFYFCFSSLKKAELAFESRKLLAVRISLNHLSNSSPLSLRLCSLLVLKALGLNHANSTVSFIAPVSLTWGGLRSTLMQIQHFRLQKTRVNAWLRCASPQDKLLLWGNGWQLTPSVYNNN